MKSLTIAYITSRREPKLEWFLDSLTNQFDEQELPLIIVTPNPVDSGFYRRFFVRETKPKPTIWQGEHRLTKEDWWAKSNALNTAICLCQTDWIAFVDDRSVLCEGWLDAIKKAMAKNYAVCGNYEKRVGLKVENGVVTDFGTLDGTDTRPQVFHRTFDWYGGSGALPLEWCLKVNGFAEDLCDSLGSEDSVFGICLRNSGYPMYYDPSMKIVEDRTPGEIDGGLRRTDKGASPNDKSHAIIARINGYTESQNSYDIRELRNKVLAGQPFPPPTASYIDWYDNQPIANF